METVTTLVARSLPLGRPIAPFGDHPGELPILGRPLAALQAEAVAAVDAQGVILHGDHTWFTAPLLRKLIAACPPTGGRLALRGPFVAATQALQELPGEELRRYPLAWAPSAGVELEALPPVEIDLDVRPERLPVDHPVFADAMGPPIPVTDAMVHTIEHWSHLLRVNLLALLATAHGERLRFEAAPWWKKALTALALVIRARSVNPWRLAAAVSPRGKGCRVHPTATVEASFLGDGVEVGPHAVVRASWLGDGVKVGEHAEVNLTVAGERSHLSRGVMANLCVLLPGAFVSPGFGHQACVFGRESFVAMGATCYDLSFGGDVKVEHRGRRVSSGQRFLGVAIGHRARVAPHVILGYGEAVPNDAFLVGDPGRIFRRIPADLGTAPAFARDGQIHRVEADGSKPVVTDLDGAEPGV